MSKWTKCENCPGKDFEHCEPRGKTFVDSTDPSYTLVVLGCSNNINDTGLMVGRVMDE
jgi:hypothetical protein